MSAPGIGHNNPPRDPLEVFVEDLQEAVQAPLARLNKLRVEQSARIPEKFATVDQAKKGISLALMIKDLIDTIELLVKNHRQPLDAKTKLMKTNGDAWLMLSQDFYGSVRNRIDNFMDTMTPGEQIRTDYGELATRREIFKFEITDDAKVSPRLRAPDDDLIKSWIKQRIDGSTAPDVIKAKIDDMAKEEPGIRVYREPQLMLIPTGKT